VLVEFVVTVHAPTSLLIRKTIGYKGAAIIGKNIES